MLLLMRRMHSLTGFERTISEHCIRVALYIRLLLFEDNPNAPTKKFHMPAGIY